MTKNKRSYAANNGCGFFTDWLAGIHSREELLPEQARRWRRLVDGLTAADDHRAADPQRFEEPVEPGDLQRDALARHLHDEIELGAGGFRAAGDVNVVVSDEFGRRIGSALA
jgi:chromosome condensin MukBEF complex kleisin-like MukF subunit